jgi:hypothetical protein
MFAIIILIHGLINITFVIGGIFCLINNHPTAGGWLIAGAIISLLCTSIHHDDNKKNNKEINT